MGLKKLKLFVSDAMYALPKIDLEDGATLFPTARVVIDESGKVVTSLVSFATFEAKGDNGKGVYKEYTELILGDKADLPSDVPSALQTMMRFTEMDFWYSDESFEAVMQFDRIKSSHILFSPKFDEREPQVIGSVSFEISRGVTNEQKVVAFDHVDNINPEYLADFGKPYDNLQRFLQVKKFDYKINEEGYARIDKNYYMNNSCSFYFVGRQPVKVKIGSVDPMFVSVKCFDLLKS